jgi:hypothetical protein
VPRISLRCTDLPSVPAARQLGLAADSDRPQAEAAKARSGAERVFALLQVQYRPEAYYLLVFVSRYPGVSERSKQLSLVARIG